MSTNKQYAIAILRNAYQPDMQGLGAVHFEMDDNQRNINLYSLDDAKARIEELDGDVYVTTNGEAGRPDYYIVDEVTADYIETGRNSDMSDYDWDNDPCTSHDNDGNACGECKECIDMMINQDRQLVQSNAVN